MQEMRDCKIAPLKTGFPSKAGVQSETEQEGVLQSGTVWYFQSQAAGQHRRGRRYLMQSPTRAAV